MENAGNKQSMCCENQQEALDHFIKAIYDNNSEYVLAHIGHIQNLNSIGSKGETPLTRAINDDDIAIIKMLLAHGADINAPCHNGWTPLQVEVSRLQDSYQIDLQDNNYTEDVQPDLSIIQFLLSYHPDLELKNNYGMRAQDMHSAIKEVQDLLEAERQWQIENNYQHP